MQYNIKDGKNLLDRLSVFHNYVNTCETLMTNQDVQTQNKIITNVIDFMQDSVCSEFKFTYDNRHAPHAFTYDDEKIPLPEIQNYVIKVLQHEWQQGLKDLKIYLPQALIHQQKQLPIQDLIQLTKHPDQYIVWKNRHVYPIDFKSFKQMIDQRLNPKLIQKLIQKPTN